MVKNGYCGWYYRVLQPGQLAPDDMLSLEERPLPHWPIDRVNRQIVQHHGSPDEKREFANLRRGLRTD
jgi:MOSC domain-containing protein YiiM